tara:strand:+ start:125 stop:412 length:288 start_codon:yes stop_codon:yes gene_type:complete
MFNIDFANADPIFRAACDVVGTPPTARQAGKWRRSTGIAFNHGRGMAIKLVTTAPIPREDLTSLTCKALRQRCSDRGIKVASKARKADLIAALEG